MLEAMKSLRDQMQSIKKSAKEVELDQSSTSASKPGPSKQSDNLPPNTAPNTQSEHTDEAMELDLYGPSLPPQLRDAQSKHGSDPNHGSSLRSFRTTRTGVFVQSQKTQTQGSGHISQSSSSEEDQSSAHKKRATSEVDQPQHDPDPLFTGK